MLQFRTTAFNSAQKARREPFYEIVKKDEKDCQQPNTLNYNVQKK